MDGFIFAIMLAVAYRYQKNKSAYNVYIRQCTQNMPYFTETNVATDVRIDTII